MLADRKLALELSTRLGIRDASFVCRGDLVRCGRGWVKLVRTVGLVLVGRVTNGFDWKVWIRNFGGVVMWWVRFQSLSNPRRLDFTRVLDNG